MFAECLCNAPKVIAMFGRMGLTMSPDLLDNGIFIHLRFPGLQYRRTVAAATCDTM